MENSSFLDPCFHEGYQRTINISDLFKNPCTSAKKKQFPFSHLHIQGEGDYQKCRRNIQKLFDKNNCPYSSCSFNGIYLPPLQGDFGVSLHILQLSITKNTRRAEPQSNARVYAPWLGQEIIYKMVFWTCNYKSSTVLAVRTTHVRATPVDTHLPVLQCSHSNPSPWGAPFTDSFFKQSFLVASTRGRKACCRLCMIHCSCRPCLLKSVVVPGWKFIQKRVSVTEMNRSAHLSASQT